MRNHYVGGLEAQVAQYRLEKERHRIEAERQRQRRESEARVAREMQLRSASSWPEALRRQVVLMEREARGDDADYFAQGALACRAALVRWEAQTALRMTELVELQARIAAIQDDIRLAVADDLAAEHRDLVGWLWIARRLRAISDPQQFLAW